MNVIKLPSKEHDLRFNRPIDRWDEALPLGNGLTGCLVWSTGSKLRLSLDRGDLWDLRPAPETMAEDFNYANLIDLVSKGAQGEILDRYDQFYEKYPYPTKLPAGRLELDFRAAADQADNRLNLREACAEVILRFGAAYTEIKTYIHAENGLGYIKISGAQSPPQLQIIPPDYAAPLEDLSESNKVFHTSLAALEYPAATSGSQGEVRWFRQQTSGQLEYAVIAVERQTSPDIIEIVYHIASSSEGSDWFEAAVRRIQSALQQGFDAAHREHCVWWEHYWSQSSITLPDPTAEKQWYLNNYFFASCSRKGSPPMPLQGVWTADEGTLPPWKGDYHHDLNTQLCYWHYLKANHLAEGESFLDLLWNLRPQAGAFSQRFFDAPGINFPSVMTIEGGPMGGWPMYSFSITNQIWLCQAFDHYWLYTGDYDFLRDRTYVFFKETAQCINRWLSPGEDGLLQLPLSSSPEIHDNTLQAWLKPNSNYDVSLLIYLYSRLIDMAERLGYAQDAALWKDIASRLPQLAVNQRSVLMVNPAESLNESHRHFSHAMAIYPLQLLDYYGSDRDRQIIDATIADLEILGKGQWCGYSFAWAAALYAQQGNGEAAFYHLHQLWTYMCSPNGFHLNGDYKRAGITMYHYRPFTLEGNMASACALQEMLLQTDRGTLRVFPAIPHDWRRQTVEFRYLRGQMGILVSSRLSGGELEYIELYAEKEGTFSIQNNFSTDEVIIQAESVTTNRFVRPHQIISISLAAGEKCMVTPGTRVSHNG